MGGAAWLPASMRRVWENCPALAVSFLYRLFVGVPSQERSRHGGHRRRGGRLGKRAASV